MNFHFPLRARQALPAVALIALLLCTMTPAISGPGAHGPNGEHLDGPTTMRAASTLPRVEASSEAFELVAELRASELAIVVDRYESNEPVLGAKLQVESGPLKAEAAFRAEQGDYAVTEAALLNALAAPGEHGLVFTLVAGKDSDLLDGTLVTTADGGAAGARNGSHGHDHALERAAWIGTGVAALGLMGGMAWWRQRRRSASRLLGSL